MTNATLAPELTTAKELSQALGSRGYAVASAETVAEMIKVTLGNLLHLTQFWEGLPRDPYLKDGGRYRFRRHASYEIKDQHLHLVPHRAHWQSLDYNALHGGIERWFEPIQGELISNPAWQSVLLGLARILSEDRVEFFGMRFRLAAEQPETTKR